MFLITLKIIISIFCGIALYTDIRRREIDDWVSIVGGIIVLFFIGFGLINKKIISYNLLYTDLNLLSAIISGIIIFVIFLFVPIGGGDMKILTFLALYSGVVGTLFIYCLANVFAFIYSLLTTKSYIKKNKEIFKDKKVKEKIKLLFKREIPLMVGIFPAVIIFLFLH